MSARVKGREYHTGSAYPHFKVMLKIQTSILNGSCMVARFSLPSWGCHVLNFPHLCAPAVLFPALLGDLGNVREGHFPLPLYTLALLFLATTV